MSIDFEERLRADMGRVEVHPRPGLAREAHRRYRQGHRRTALAVAATGTAAAVAGATAGLALTAGGSGTPPIETTAYVVNRVSGALAATDTIGYSISWFTGPGTANTGQTRAWKFGGRNRVLLDTPAGRPSFDSSSRAKGHSSVVTDVDYQNRTWTIATLPDPPPTTGSLCGGHVGAVFSDRKSAADWRRVIETGLKCGAFTVAGRQWVDGVDAIKLADHKTAHDYAIWVDPGSYLPVRLVIHPQDIAVVSPAGPTSLTLTIDFRWLAPTPANLAKLTAPIPPGFHKVNFHFTG